jgi:hypothetical protein
MPRQLRLEYPGAIYHVSNRGDRREDIFRDDADRSRFLETLGDARKVKLARLLRAETTMTLAWVAQHLAMGRRGYVAQLLKGTAKSANIKD